VRESDIIFVSVNTPTKHKGFGAGKAADLSFWEKAGRCIGTNSISPKIVVEKSTVPVKTAAALSTVLMANCAHPAASFVVLSNPEFLAEGTAISDLTSPDRVLIGGPDTPEGAAAIRTLSDVYANWVPRDRILTTNTWSAELSKLVSVFCARNSCICPQNSSASVAGGQRFSRSAHLLSERSVCFVREHWRRYH
jgi:UDPglucose 6-dehydrogenase